MTRLSCLLFFALAAVRPDAARPLDYTLTGDVALGVTSADDGEPLARVDMIFGLPLGYVEDRKVALELGTFAYFLRGDRPHETYAAIAIDDRLRFGATKPAYDMVLPSVFAHRAPWVANIRAEYVRAYATTKPMRQNAVPWGISYIGTADGLDWGVSVHHGEERGLSAVSGSVRWQDGPWQVAGAVEAVWNDDGGYRGTNAKLGGTWTGKRFDLGLAWLHPGGSSRADALAFDLGYAASPNLSLSVFGEATETGRDEAYGLAADYAIDKRTHVILSTTTSTAGEDLHLTLTRKY